MVIVGAGCVSTTPTSLSTSTSPKVGTSAAMPKQSLPQYKEIQDPAGYVNTEKITIGELIGKKVVMIDFVTYSCINCIRTFPYLNTWYEKYKDNGLEIIGIHTPEFAFEKKYENVAKAMQEYNIKFPVVLDNDYATWRAYGNRFWPRKYLIDIHGNIVYDHIGEGAYEETEQRIQEALEERMAFLGEQDEMEMEKNMAKPVGLEEVEFGKVASPEVYLGAGRNEYLANGTRGEAGQQTLDIPDRAEVNKLYLGGVWNVTPEYAEHTSGTAKLIFRYRAKRVNIVATSDTSVPVGVFVDGAPVGKRSGAHVTNNKVNVAADQLYEVVDDPEGYGEHTLELRFPQPGVRVFTLTFG